MARRFGWWQRLHDEPALEHRKRTGAGFSPVNNVAQLLFTLTSGGASPADAGRLAQDRLFLGNFCQRFRKFLIGFCSQSMFPCL